MCRSEQLVISVIGILMLCRYSTSSIKSGLFVGSPPSYYTPDTIFLDTLSKTIFHCCVIRSEVLGALFAFPVGITEGTHRTVKIAIVSHTEHCHNRTPPLLMPYSHPHLLMSPDSAYGVNQFYDF